MGCDQVVVAPVKVLKELVTNLTDNETLVKAAVFAGVSDPCNQYSFIKKYQEGGNWIFQFELEKSCNIAEFGAAGLANFIKANFKAIAWLLATAGIISIVWMWRDVSSGRADAEVLLDESITDRIKEIQNDPNLSDDEKTKLITAILSGLAPKDGGTDMIILAGVALLAASFLFGSKKGR